MVSRAHENLPDPRLQTRAMGLVYVSDAQPGLRRLCRGKGFSYRDAEGRYWGIDNRHEHPKWLSGTTPAAWVDFWEPDKKAISLVADVSNPKLFGKTADKDRLDRLTGAPRTMVASNR